MPRLTLSIWLLIFLSGCSSVATQMWTRDRNEYLHPDCDGCLKGVPVMLKVPSHIEVKITETLFASYWYDDNKFEFARLDAVKLRRPDLSVDATLKYTEKMFLVDPVKVASGSGAYGFGFGGSGKNANGGSAAGHGYLTSADYQAVDSTIKDSASLIASIGKYNKAKRSAMGDQDGLSTITRVVAFQRFDLGSPTVDEEVHAFLDQHLNCCDSCETFSTRAYTTGDGSINGVPGAATTAGGEQSGAGGEQSEADGEQSGAGGEQSEVKGEQNGVDRSLRGNY